MMKKESTRKMNKIEEDIQQLITNLKKNKKISALVLFGSSVTGRLNALSDVDICIFGNLNFEERLKILSLFSDKYDVSFFNDLPIWIKIRVFREGKIVFCKDRNEIYDALFKTIRNYEDFLPLIKRRVIERFGKWQI